MDDEFIDIRNLLQGIDWTIKGFDINKAKVCSTLSKLAYMSIPKYELADNERIKIVPCQKYQTLILMGVGERFEQIIRENDFIGYFSIHRKYAVAVGFRTDEAVFIAIRGTKYLYDWIINLNAKRHRLFDDVKVHSGFLRALLPIVEPLEAELEKILNRPINKEVPIYVTGHSLGGAMAALLHAKPRMSIRHYDEEWWSGRYQIATKSCYTYGMPRYGNLSAILNMDNPYHIYNPDDIVPTVPPRWLGYANSLSEYRVDGSGIENISRGDSRHFFHYIKRLMTGKTLDDHSIEEYEDRLLKLK